MRLSLALLVCAALSLVAAACNTQTSRIGSQPSWRQSSEVAASGTAAGPADAVGAMVFAPVGPAAAAYNDPPITPAPSFPLGDRIVAAIEAAAALGERPAPIADGRLYAVARELAEVVPEDSPVAYPLVEFAMHRHGIIEPSPHLVVIWGPIDDPDASLAELEERLPDILASGRFGRIGVGVAARGRRGDAVTVLALQASHVRTRPIPRALPAGGVIRLEGSIDAPFRDPGLFVTRDDGIVEEIPVRLSGQQDFSADVSCANRRGRQQIEITAADALGSTVLANFPVWCNESAPSSITVEPTVDDVAAAGSVAAAERRMVELVNADRARHGLAPLVADPSVAAVARAHSEEMAATGVVAHVSPTTGAASDRVRAAGIRTALVLENIARAYGLADAQQGLMNSPGHRANILSETATHLGVGIVIGAEVADRREVFVTQVFTRVPPPVDRAQAARSVHAALAAVRAVGHDPELSALAQRYADDVTGGLAPDQASARASRGLDALAHRYRRVTMALTTVADIVSFDARATLHDRNITHYGLGVAQGWHDTLGENAIYVIVLIAEAR
jgi:uncharacterized protein YkwD